MQENKDSSQKSMSRWVQKARVRDVSLAPTQHVKHIRRRSYMGATRVRIVFALIGFCAFYGVLGGRLVQLAQHDKEHLQKASLSSAVQNKARPDIVDRMGNMLATDIRSYAVFAEPRRLVDVDEAVNKLGDIFPDLSRDVLYKRLSSKSGFEWVVREITPRQRDLVHHLGLPGIGFHHEARRFYPSGELFSHLLGAVDVDHKGLSGMERYVDQSGVLDLQGLGFSSGQHMRLKPLALSVDMRVQHAVRHEMLEALERYQAKAGVAIVLDVKTGEVVSMVSLPDFDPNDRSLALSEERLNRASAGVFEMGSVFKVFTTAAALDSGRVAFGDEIDARKPIRIARRTIRDFHAKARILTVPEVFIYSSNIGTAKMAMSLGIDGQKDYFARLGLLERMKLELPESAKPLLPRKWDALSAMTVSFGHGISVTPLHVAAACAALMNGGVYISPTFVKRGFHEAQSLGRQVVKPQTSQMMRHLMRLNVEEGSGRRADVEGLYVGGKTGTAEKVVNGAYSSEKKLNSFLAAFPIDEPQYVVLVTLDEPEPEPGKRSATAGLNTAPTAGKIIEKIGPMLGVMPKFQKNTTLNVSLGLQ